MVEKVGITTVNVAGAGGGSAIKGAAPQKERLKKEDVMTQGTAPAPHHWLYFYTIKKWLKYLVTSS